MGENNQTPSMLTLANDEQATEFVFTSKSVESLLRKTVFRDKGPRAGLCMPTIEALDNLALELDGMRETFRDEIGRSDKTRKIANRFTAAFAELEASLPDTINQTKQSHIMARNLLERCRAVKMSALAPQKFGNIVTIKEIQEVAEEGLKETAIQIESLNVLLSAMAETRKHDKLFMVAKVSRTRWGHPVNHWHGYVHMIARDLRGTIRSANPSAVLSFSSNDGPVPRFIAAVLPMITGDKPTPVAIGKWLKEHPDVTRDGPEG